MGDFQANGAASATRSIRNATSLTQFQKSATPMPIEPCSPSDSESLSTPCRLSQPAEPQLLAQSQRNPATLLSCLITRPRPRPSNRRNSGRLQYRSPVQHSSCTLPSSFYPSAALVLPCSSASAFPQEFDTRSPVTRTSFDLCCHINLTRPAVCRCISAPGPPMSYSNPPFSAHRS